MKPAPWTGRPGGSEGGPLQINMQLYTELINEVQCLIDENVFMILCFTYIGISSPRTKLDLKEKVNQQVANKQHLPYK